MASRNRRVVTPRQWVGGAVPMVVLACTFALSSCRTDPPDATRSATAATTGAAPTVLIVPTVPTVSITVTPDPNMFTSVSATVTDADGNTCDLCVWLADTDTERGVGLMHVTDLDGRDGMAFVYPEPHSTNFWMKNTVMPLSIAFFDANGLLLDSFDMEPCTDNPCPHYPTPSDFTVALEVQQGKLADLGIEPQATLSLSDLPCSNTAAAASA